MNTATFKTASGVEIEHKDFITGRDKRHITDAFLEDVEITQDSKAGQSFTMSGSKANVATDRAIEAVIVRVGEATTGILDAILDLPAEDYDQVVAKVNEITGEKKSVTGSQS